MTEIPCRQCGVYGDIHFQNSEGFAFLDTNDDFERAYLADMPKVFQLQICDPETGQPYADSKIAKITVTAEHAVDGTCGENCPPGTEPCQECSDAPEVACDLLVKFQWDYDDEAGSTIYGLALSEERHYDVEECEAGPLVVESLKTNTYGWDLLQLPEANATGHKNASVVECAHARQYEFVLFDNTTWDPTQPKGPTNTPAIAATMTITVACEPCCERVTQEPE
jgi:hypothetical protein